MSGHTASLNKYRKIEIISCILSDHNKTTTKETTETAQTHRDQITQY